MKSLTASCQTFPVTWVSCFFFVLAEFTSWVQNHGESAIIKFHWEPVCGGLPNKIL